MDRISKLVQKQLQKPHGFNQLKGNPFPYLQECNRLEIFQFIYQLKRDNSSLKQQIQRKYPEQTLEQVLDKNKALKLKKKILEIHKQSLSKMEIQIQDKMAELEKVKLRNDELGNQNIVMEKVVIGLQQRLIEVQQIKKEIELKMNFEKSQGEKIDLSQIFKNLYTDVKQTLTKY